MQATTYKFIKTQTKTMQRNLFDALAYKSVYGELPAGVPDDCAVILTLITGYEEMCAPTTETPETIEKTGTVEVEEVQTVIETDAEIKRKRSEAGRKGMINRWKNNKTDNKTITNSDFVITSDNKSDNKTITNSDFVITSDNKSDNKTITNSDFVITQRETEKQEKQEVSPYKPFQEEKEIKEKEKENEKRKHKCLKEKSKNSEIENETEAETKTYDKPETEIETEVSSRARAKSENAGAIVAANLEKRKQKFLEGLKEFAGKYPETMLSEFGSYWTEKNRSNTRMRFELEKTWELSRRLGTWANRSDMRRGGVRPKSGGQDYATGVMYEDPNLRGVSLDSLPKNEFGWPDMSALFEKQRGQ